MRLNLGDDRPIRVEVAGIHTLHISWGPFTWTSTNAEAAQLAADIDETLKD